MKPVLSATGATVRLRPARTADLRFLYDLRLKANARSTVRALQDYAAHEAWFRQYLQREDDCLFVAENILDKAACGSSALHDIIRGDSAEFGRWLAWPGQRRGPEIFNLTFKIGFEHLNLNMIRLRVMARNRPVVEFYEAAGMVRSSHAPRPEEVNGLLEAMEIFTMDASTWFAEGRTLPARLSRI